MPRRLRMSHFVNLFETLRTMKADPATARDPIKRQFLFDGQFITANAAVLEESGNALHTQPDHEEVVLIVDGAADFQVGAEVRRVSSGDLIFIPRNTLHGPILGAGDRLATLSLYAPFFDRSRKHIIWEKDRTEASA
jgi:mannose-6-phosphate isomerase-like protein (cupin superfamily)